MGELEILVSEEYAQERITEIERDLCEAGVPMECVAVDYVCRSAGDKVLYQPVVLYVDLDGKTRKLIESVKSYTTIAFQLTGTLIYSHPFGSSDWHENAVDEDFMVDKSVGEYYERHGRLERDIKRDGINKLKSRFPIEGMHNPTLNTFYNWIGNRHYLLEYQKSNHIDGKYESCPDEEAFARMVNTYRQTKLKEAIIADLDGDFDLHQNKNKLILGGPDVLDESKLATALEDIRKKVRQYIAPTKFFDMYTDIKNDLIYLQVDVDVANKSTGLHGMQTAHPESINITAKKNATILDEVDEIYEDFRREQIPSAVMSYLNCGVIEFTDDGKIVLEYCANEFVDDFETIEKALRNAQSRWEVLEEWEVIVRWDDQVHHHFNFRHGSASTERVAHIQRLVNELNLYKKAAWMGEWRVEHADEVSFKADNLGDRDEYTDYLIDMMDEYTISDWRIKFKMYTLDGELGHNFAIDGDEVIGCERMKVENELLTIGQDMKMGWLDARLNNYEEGWYVDEAEKKIYANCAIDSRVGEALKRWLKDNQDWRLVNFSRHSEFTQTYIWKNHALVLEQEEEEQEEEEQEEEEQEEERTIGERIKPEMVFGNEVKMSELSTILQQMLATPIVRPHYTMFKPPVEKATDIEVSNMDQNQLEELRRIVKELTSELTVAGKFEVTDVGTILYSTYKVLSEKGTYLDLIEDKIRRSNVINDTLVYGFRATTSMNDEVYNGLVVSGLSEGARWTNCTISELIAREFYGSKYSWAGKWGYDEKVGGLYYKLNDLTPSQLEFYERYVDEVAEKLGHEGKVHLSLITDRGIIASTHGELQPIENTTEEQSDKENIMTDDKKVKPFDIDFKGSLSANRRKAMVKSLTDKGVNKLVAIEQLNGFEQAMQNPLIRNGFLMAVSYAGGKGNASEFVDRLPKKYRAFAKVYFETLFDTSSYEFMKEGGDQMLDMAEVYVNGLLEHAEEEYGDLMREMAEEAEEFVFDNDEEVVEQTDEYVLSKINEEEEKEEVAQPQTATVGE